VDGAMGIVVRHIQGVGLVGPLGIGGGE
jgi:hypothetical protein